MKLKLAIVLSATLATAAFAHSGASGIVKERMDGMLVLAASMKSLGQMMKSGDVDPAMVKAAAENIKGQSGHALTHRFPEGSTQHPSDASAAIWENFAKFEAISMDMQRLADQLAADAMSADLDLGAYVKDLGATCSSCHKDFRVRN